MRILKPSRQWFECFACGRSGFGGGPHGLQAFLASFMLALCLGTIQLADPKMDRLAITADSAMYHNLAEGIEQLIREPALLKGLISHQLSSQERERLGVDRWELQHAPAYVLPLGVLYALLPSNEGAGRAFSVVLYALSAGLLVLLGRCLLGGLLAWAALLGYLLYLPFLYYGTGICTEAHATFVLLLTAWLLVGFHRRPTRRRGLLAGLSLGLLFLAKTTFRPLAVILLAGEAIALLRRRRGSRLPALLLGGGLPIGLWYGFLGLAAIQPGALVASGESQLWIYRGNYVPDQGWETVGLGDAITPELEAAERGVALAQGIEINEMEMKRQIYLRAFLLTVQGDPVGWVSLIWKKLGLFWTCPSRKAFTRCAIGSWAIPRWIHLLLFPLGLLGFSVAVCRSPYIWVPGLLALGVAGVHAVSHLVARYHLPVLPIWWLYALLGLRAIWITGRRVLLSDRLHQLRVLPWRWLLLGLGAFLAGSWLRAPTVSTSPELGRGMYIAGALLCGLSPLALVALMMALAREMRGVKRPVWCLAVGPLLFAGALTGQLVSERDWDEFGYTLKTPGEVLVQRIAVPEEGLGSGRGIQLAWLEIDMLRSPRGHFALDVLVGGMPVHSFEDTLGGRYEVFRFSEKIHSVQDRYRRVADTYQHFVAEFLNPRYGHESIGYDYFRRWVRVRVPKSLLQTDTIEVELRLRKASDGGWVKVFADRCPILRPKHLFVGPVIGKQPYEHSSYRVQFYAGDRERMDARLTREEVLQSPGTESLRRLPDGRMTGLGSPWRSHWGELRIRLRVQLKGMLAARRKADGRMTPVWVEELQAGERKLTAEEARRFQWRRDRYFDGTWVY